jgi:predicted RNase H-like HicB family nuclease
MRGTQQLTAIIEREDDGYVAFSPELDIASQGDTVETARTNLIEALKLFFESADKTELARGLHTEVFVTRVEVAVG